MTYSTRSVRRYSQREARELYERSIGQVNLRQRWQIAKGRSIKLMGFDPTVYGTRAQRERDQQFWFERDDDHRSGT
jgi:hypothetical protein